MINMQCKMILAKSIHHFLSLNARVPNKRKNEMVHPSTLEFTTNAKITKLSANNKEKMRVPFFERAQITKLSANKNSFASRTCIVGKLTPTSQELRKVLQNYAFQFLKANLPSRRHPSSASQPAALSNFGSLYFPALSFCNTWLAE